jgi:hypothetical protein
VSNLSVAGVLRVSEGVLLLEAAQCLKYVNGPGDAFQASRVNSAHVLSLVVSIARDLGVATPAGHCVRVVGTQNPGTNIQHGSVLSFSLNMPTLQV